MCNKMHITVGFYIVYNTLYAKGYNNALFWYNYMRSGIILYFLLLLCLPVYSQQCKPENNFKINTPSQGIKYSVSHGFCYHFNSTTVETGYKNHYLSITIMNKNILFATPRMQDESYIGYTYNQPLSKKLNIGASTYLRTGNVSPVIRLYADRKIYKPLYLHGSIIKVIPGMSHIIIGLKIII